MANTDSDADTVILDDIEESVKTILPNITKTKLSRLMEHLVAQGIQSTSDLFFLDAEDLPMLNVIESRKLSKAWKEQYTSKFKFI